MLKFCEDTDTHGMKFLADSASSRSRKVLWVALIAGSVGFLAYFFQLRVTQYFQHDVSTKITVSEGRINLPAVKICSREGTIIDTRKLTASDIVNARKKPFGRIISNASLVARFENGSKYLKPEAINVFRMSIGNMTRIRQLMELGWFEETPANETSAWNVLLQTLIDHGSEKPIENWQEYNLNEVIRRVYYDYTEGITCTMRPMIGEPKNCNEGWKILFVHQGLCVVNDQLNDDVYAYSPITIFRRTGSVMPFGYQTVYNVLLEDRNINHMHALARIKSPSVTLGHFQTLRVTKKTEIHKLPAPFSNCSDMNGNQSRTKCIEECVSSMYLNMFGCQEFFIFSQNKSKLCQHQDINSSQFRMVKYNCYFSCPPSCYYESYDLVQYKYGLVMDLKKYTMPVMIRVLSSEAVEILRIQEIELYPLGSLLAELGGTMGLFIGISLLSVAHLVECLVRSMLATVRCKKRPRVDPNDPNK